MVTSNLQWHRHLDSSDGQSAFSLFILDIKNCRNISSHGLRLNLQVASTIPLPSSALQDLLVNVKRRKLDPSYECYSQCFLAVVRSDNNMASEVLLHRIWRRRSEAQVQLPPCPCNRDRITPEKLSYMF
uniref:Uncharacterized protein n=1 Tax=Physcomitrium patens TaxID=3218 RepID=A0A2K1IEG2_PHYPA|nr:hypothetical protein PHYPA_029819 [Physcomitrium patens]